MRKRTTLHCPVCGIPMITSCLRAHVASDRCLMRLYVRNDGKHADAVRGPKAVRLVIALIKLLKAQQKR